MPKFTKEDLLEIIQRFSLDNLTELNLKTEEVTLELKKDKPVEIGTENIEKKIDHNLIDEKENTETDYYQVKSPMVGVFYEASEPEAEPFVKIGDQVEKGDTLYIIEAMKMIHEISSPVSGEIKNILIEDKDIVEYSQIVMEISQC